MSRAAATTTTACTNTEPANVPYGAVVGLGNTWWIQTDQAAAASAIWSLGWLVLMTAGITTAVAALRRRQARWAAGITACLIASVVIGVAVSGTRTDQAGVQGLALALAAMTLTAATGVVGYAWRASG